MHGYIAFYRGRRLEIYADSLSQAKEYACAAFKAVGKRRHDVTVCLAELNARQPVSA